MKTSFLFLLGLVICLSFPHQAPAYALFDSQADVRTMAVWNYLQSQSGGALAR